MPQLERIPPHSDDAERSVLGSVLIDKEIYFKVSEFIKTEDFYTKSHQEIFAAMTELHNADAPIDVVTVAETLQRRKTLDACGGRSYLADLSSEVPTTANAVQYAKIIAEKSIYRKLIKAGSEIVECSFDEKQDSQIVLDKSEEMIFNISKTRQTRDFVKIQNVLVKNIEDIKEAEKMGGQIPGVASGFTKLDYMTAGFQKSDLIILAARPSMGKTAFALNIAQNVALKGGKRVAIFSVEMSEESLGLRLLSMESRVESKKLRNGTLNEDEWESVRDAVERFQKADIIIDATPNIGVMEVRNKCRRMNAEKHIDLIVIDYLQIMSSEGRSDNRVDEVRKMTQSLKQLAREMECPVLCLSQLSRGSEKRQGEDKRPMLSDLRDSGSIEQDADVVMFLHREDYYHRDREPDNVCEVIIAKQRQGETGTVKLTWIPKFTKFANMENSNMNFAPEQAN